METRTEAASPDEVGRFYDAFSREKMLDYRVHGNARIEKAIAFFCASLTPEDVVLDIGCGIGIATEAMAKRTRAVAGIDISEQNIWYAKRTIARPNLSFHVADVLSPSFDIAAILERPPSAITLCDVIEHIPEQSRIRLFTLLAKSGAADLRVLLTLPTPFTLERMERETPHELQIIDNKIPPEVLAREAAMAGLSMTNFRMVDIWRGAEYAQCMLERTDRLRDRARQDVSAQPRWLPIEMAKRVRHSIACRYRRRRYIHNVVGGS